MDIRAGVKIRSKGVLKKTRTESNQATGKHLQPQPLRNRLNIKESILDVRAPLVRGRRGKRPRTGGTEKKNYV